MKRNLGPAAIVGVTLLIGSVSWVLWSGRSPERRDVTASPTEAKGARSTARAAPGGNGAGVVTGARGDDRLSARDTDPVPPAMRAQMMETLKLYFGPTLRAMRLDPQVEERAMGYLIARRESEWMAKQVAQESGGSLPAARREAHRQVDQEARSYLPEDVFNSLQTLLAADIHLPAIFSYYAPGMQAAGEPLRDEQYLAFARAFLASYGSRGSTNTMASSMLDSSGLLPVDHVFLGEAAVVLTPRQGEILRMRLQEKREKVAEYARVEIDEMNLRYVGAILRTMRLDPEVEALALRYLSARQEASTAAYQAVREANVSPRAALQEGYRQVDQEAKAYLPQDLHSRIQDLIAGDAYLRDIKNWFAPSMEFAGEPLRDEQHLPLAKAFLASRYGRDRTPGTGQGGARLDASGLLPADHALLEQAAAVLSPRQLEALRGRLQGLRAGPK
jgi:hypothetical protein